MRFVHMADLHLGRSIGEMDLTGDQAHALHGVLDIVKASKPDAVLIAGDVYDKPQPSAWAVELADDFFTRLLAVCPTVCVIGGNHDSTERLSFARRILCKRGLHIAGSYQGRLETVPAGDGLIWLMPFFRPREVSEMLGGLEKMTYDAAVRAAIARETLPGGQVNLLMAHQFVTGGPEEAAQSESELELSTVGGVANVDFHIFDAFDYVALGHLHSPQRIGRDRVRYAGSLLKYSASEARHKKSLVVGEVTKSSFQYELVPIPFLRDLRVIKGRLGELTSPLVVSAHNQEDLLHVTLTDDLFPPDALQRLRQHYPNVFRLEYLPPAAQQPALYERRSRTAGELFREFYQLRNGLPMTEAMAAYMDGVFEEAGREGAK